MKFSIIVPVYNVEKYIKKCLVSINNQSYQNFEAIIVNDGTTDNSENIINKYIEGKENFIYFKKENGGLSDARNYGVKRATGDYIIFVDSDDYIEKDLLDKLNNLLSSKKYDVVRYGVSIVDDQATILEQHKNATYAGKNKSMAIKAIISSCHFEEAWLYAYNLKFWNKHNFLYQKGRIHEDYGLTPLILSKANSIGFLDYYGYNYVQRDNSIMHQTDYEKIKKRVNDFKEQYLILIKKIKNNNQSNKLIRSYISEALIYKGGELNKEDRKDYIEFIKRNKITDEIYASNIKKIIKKFLININLAFYLYILNRKFYKKSYSD